MDYPSYRRTRWKALSALVEGICTHVVEHWMRGAGQRKSERGANAMVSLHSRVLIDLLEAWLRHEWQERQTIL